MKQITMKQTITLLLLGCNLLLNSQNTILNAMSPEDSSFFAGKKAMLTATCHVPFSYSSIKSNYAPRGPYMAMSVWWHLHQTVVDKIVMY